MCRDLIQSRELTLGGPGCHTVPYSSFNNETCPEQRVARQCHRRVSTIHQSASQLLGVLLRGRPRPQGTVLSRGHRHQRLLAEDGVTRELQPTVTARPGYQTAESKRCQLHGPSAAQVHFTARAWPSPAALCPRQLPAPRRMWSPWQAPRGDTPPARGQHPLQLHKRL